MSEIKQYPALQIQLKDSICIYRYRFAEICNELNISTAKLATEAGLLPAVMYYLKQEQSTKAKVRIPQLDLLLKILTAANRIAAEQNKAKRYTLDDLIEIDISL